MKSLKRIALAGGCFWGTEHYFQQIQGITDTEVGYANGPEDHAPRYEEVKSGLGHAETVMITYDETVISLKEILHLYLRSVDPFSVNQQGHDKGIQYRTGIYYLDAEQEETAKSILHAFEEDKGRKSAIEIKKLHCFFPAEEYHQDYLIKNPAGYCHLPKALFEEARRYKPSTTEV